VTVDVLTPRPLGRTGRYVTAVCVGTGEIGDMSVYGGSVPEERALATARRAFAGPLNFVDTSNGYGVSEQRIGIVLRQIGAYRSGPCSAPRSTLSMGARSTAHGYVPR